MILSEYQAKRETLEEKLQEIGSRQSEHKMELCARYQKKISDLNSKIGQLEKQKKDALKEYQNDKAWFRKKYREEKQQVIMSIHLLKMEYTKENGVKEGGAA